MILFILQMMAQLIMMLLPLVNGFIQESLMLTQNNMPKIFRDRRIIIDVIDSYKINNDGIIDFNITINNLEKKKFALDMLCDHGGTTIEMYNLYKDCLVFGCTNDDKKVFTKDVLTKRYPNCLFYDFDGLKQWAPDYFDIIQVHHQNLIINNRKDEIYEYIDTHLNCGGYIIYNFNDSQDIKNIHFFNRGYRSWIYSKQVFFNR